MEVALADFCAEVLEHGVPHIRTPKKPDICNGAENFPHDAIALRWRAVIYCHRQLLVRDMAAHCVFAHVRRGRGTLPLQAAFSDLTFTALRDGRRRDPRAEASMIRGLLVPALTLAVLPAVSFFPGAGAPGPLGTSQQHRACRPHVQRLCPQTQNQSDYSPS